jgi:hypothetical protein
MIDLSKHEPQIKKLGLQLYQPSFEQDNHLLRLWLHLVESGDLALLLPSGSHPLSRFLTLFQPPAITVYCLDSQGVWLISWFTPTAGASEAAFCSFWARSDKRGTRSWLRSAKLVYTIAFEIWSTIFGITHQSKLFDIHQKFGYTVSGVAEGLLETGKTSYLVRLTKEAFENSRAYKTRS